MVRRRSFLKTLPISALLSGCIASQSQFYDATVERRYTFTSSTAFVADQPELDDPIETVHAELATNETDADRVFDWNSWNQPDHAEPYRSIRDGDECLCVLVGVVHPGYQLMTSESAVDDGTVRYTVGFKQKDSNPDPDIPDPIFSYVLDKWRLDGTAPPSDVTLVPDS